MLVSGQELLDRAVAGRHAIGSFNTYNLEITRAILSAAESRDTPVFLAVGRGAFANTGFAPLVAAMLAAADESRVPVAVHLDHSTDIALIERCVAAGFTSFMVDGSKLPLEQNIRLTRDAVRAANGATVEAELGGIGGAEDRSGEHATEIPMTDPDEAARLAAETGVASLAVAIGNAHGVYSGEPRLDFERLALLAKAVSVPLVLHGASGISDADIRRCVALGIRKINVNTEIRQALFGALSQSLQGGGGGYDVTRLFASGIDAMRQVVEDKLSLLAG